MFNSCWIGFLGENVYDQSIKSGTCNNDSKRRLKNLTLDRMLPIV